MDVTEGRKHGKRGQARVPFTVVRVGGGVFGNLPGKMGVQPTLFRLLVWDLEMGNTGRAKFTEQASQARVQPPSPGALGAGRARKALQGRRLLGLCPHS